MTRFAAAGPWRWIVAGLGVVLLGLLFAPWYDVDWGDWTRYAPANVDSGGFAGDPVLGTTGDEYVLGTYWTVGDLNGWGTVGVVSLLAALLSVAGIMRALVLRTVRRPWVDRALMGVAVVAGLAIAARIVWPPDDLLVAAWGAWASLGVVLAILIANGMDSIAGR